MIAILATTSCAEAHALGAEVRIKEKVVWVEGFFSDNTPARNASVQVRDSSNQLIAEGRTDNDGRWSFQKPSPGRFSVIMDAGAGHRTQLSIEIPQSAAADLLVSDGPTRQEFTRFPWGKMLVGLALIAGLGMLAMMICRRRVKPTR